MFISYMFRPARAILSYEELYKNTKIDLHDPVNNWDVSFYIWFKQKRMYKLIFKIYLRCYSSELSVSCGVPVM